MQYNFDPEFIQKVQCAKRRKFWARIFFYSFSPVIFILLFCLLGHGIYNAIMVYKHCKPNIFDLLIGFVAPGLQFFLILLFGHLVFIGNKKLTRLKMLIIKTLAVHKTNIPIRSILDTIAKNRENLEFIYQLPLADLIFASHHSDIFSPYAHQIKNISSDPEKNERFSSNEIIMRADYFLNETESAYRKIQPLEIDPLFKDFECEERIIFGGELISLFFTIAELKNKKGSGETFQVSDKEEDIGCCCTIIQCLCHEVKSPDDMIDKIHIDLRGISFEKFTANFDTRKKTEIKVRTYMHLGRTAKNRAIKKALKDKGFYGDGPELKISIFNNNNAEKIFSLPAELTIFAINYFNYWTYGNFNCWTEQNRKIRMKKKDGSYITLQFILTPGQECILQRIGEE